MCMATGHWPLARGVISELLPVVLSKDAGEASIQGPFKKWYQKARPEGPIYGYSVMCARQNFSPALKNQKLCPYDQKNIYPWNNWLFAKMYALQTADFNIAKLDMDHLPIFAMMACTIIISTIGLIIAITGICILAFFIFVFIMG